MTTLSGQARGPIRFAGHLGLRNPEAPLFAHSARSIAPLDQIDRLAELGFAGMFDIALKLRTPAEQSAIGSRLAQRGLDMGSFGSDPLHWNEPLWSRADEDARAALGKSVAASVETADRVGGGAVVCVTGLDPARTKETQIAGMVENLKRVADTAVRGGLTLLVEPVAEGWIPGLLVDRLADAAAIVRAVDHPSVRLIFDIAHVRMSGEGDDMTATLARHWDIVGGVQAADMPGRIDLGAGELDWTAILGWIADRSYAGLVEIEHEPIESSAEGEARLVEGLRRIEATIAKGHA